MTEPQRRTRTFVFKVRHSPGTDPHLDQIIDSTLESKGLKIVDGEIEL
jgi:hypothetical protein